MMLKRTELLKIDRLHINRVFIWMLALLTGVTLVLQVPAPGIVQQYQALLLIYALLTALAIYFSAALAEGEISSAHVVGMIAALSLPPDTAPAALWALALGGLTGGLLLLWRTSALRLSARLAAKLVTTLAQVTLSFFVASTVYHGVGGDLPLDQLDQRAAPALVAFFAVYTLVYFALFLLQAYIDGLSIRRLLANSTAEIAVVLTLPVPFALLGAEVYDKLSGAAFVFLILGVTLTVIGVYGISRAQRQLRKQVDEMRSLSVVSQVVSANLKLDTLLNMIYLQVTQLLDVHHFLVALYDSDNRLTYPLVVRAGQPVTDKAAMTWHEGLVNYILEIQEPLLINSRVGTTASQAGLHPPSSPFDSWLGVPLISGGRLLGAIVVTLDDAERAFSTDDLRLLSIVAASASIAVENAQLYEQQTKRADELARLNNIISLLTGTLSPEAVLDTVISSASTLSDASAVAVYLFWEDNLALARSAGLSSDFSKDPPDPLLSLSRYDQSNLQPAPLVVRDLHDDARTPHLRALMNAEGKQAWVELPLLVGGLGLGVIILYYNEPRSFSHEQIEVLRAFANQVSQAIRNARQYELADETLERRVGQLLALAIIGYELTATVDEQSICDLVVHQALDATHATTGAMILADMNSGSPRVVSYQGDAPIPVAHPLMSQIYQMTTPYLSTDLTPEARYRHLSPSTRSQLIAPVQRSGKNLGLVVLESAEPQAFSEDDIQFIALLANQAVIALDNARLFHRIAEARDRLQVILDTMSEAIILIDREGIIALANPRVDLIELRADQLLARHVEDVLAQDDLEVTERMGFKSSDDLRKLLKDMRSDNGWTGYAPESYSLRVGSALRYIQRLVIPVRDPNRQIIGALLTFYDETEERALEEAREDLSRMIIHDLRSPLTAVTTSLKLLTDLIPNDSELKPVVQTTSEAGRRAVRKLMSRVDSLLDVARMQSGQMSLERRPAELATLIDSVCVELSPLAHELNVRVESRVPDDLPPLDIDPDKVERLLLNLLDNALKFSPTDSVVSITTHPPESSGFVRIDVIDQGPGVPEEYKHTLFDRFVEVKGRVGRRRGTGLGLTFCRLVVEAHGGTIWIEDSPQGGSIFAFRLPLVQLAEAAASTSLPEHL
jgi:K+-sensing histidine kinase KdpD